MKKKLARTLLGLSNPNYFYSIQILPSPKISLIFREKFLSTIANGTGMATIDSCKKFLPQCGIILTRFVNCERRWVGFEAMTFVLQFYSLRFVHTYIYRKELKLALKELVSCYCLSVALSGPKD